MNPIEIYADNYNARLFPCKKRSFIGDKEAKRPLLEGWRGTEHPPAELLRYWVAGHPIAWALGPNDLIVDVDAPNSEKPDKQGLVSLEKLNNLLGVPLSSVAPVVRTEHGGQHYYLTIPEGLNLRKTIKDLPDIDFLTEGMYVLIAGSIHWLGGHYSFAPETELLDDYGRPECPSVLLDLITKGDAIGDTVATEISGELLSRMLAPLDPRQYSNHSDWFSIFAASHHATGGTDDGLEAFVAWSLLDDDYRGHGEKIRHRWRTLDPTASGGLTVATLFGELDATGNSDAAAMVRAAIEFDDEDFSDPEQYDPELFGFDAFDFAPTAGEKKAKKLKKKKIVYGFDELKLNDKIIERVAKMPNIFQRSKMLVTISDSEILPLNPLGLCEQISSVVDLGVETEDKKTGETEWASKRIPERVGKQIAARASWFGVRRLKAVTPIPLLTTAGPLQTPGYDALSGVFYSKTIDVPRIANNPSLNDATAAAALLFETVVDFPFASDSHRSAWLASLLTVLARPAIEGPTPLTFVDGNQRGVGRGLLTDLVYLICFGENMPKQASMPTDEAEMSKVMLSIAMRNRPTYNFDNLPSGSKIGSPSLDSVLTNGTVAGRILGRSEIQDYPIDTVFFASGNRIALDKNTDIIRRLNYINLQSKEEKAERRQDFKHGGEASLRQYVKDRRAALIHAGLTILEHARQNDEDLKLPADGSYQSFSNVVRRAIVLIGEPDPLDTRLDLEMRDETRGELAIVIDALAEIGAVSVDSGMPASEIFTKLDSFEDDQPLVLSQALQLLAPRGTDNPVVRTGVRLSKHYRDQVCDGRWIRFQKNPSKKVNVFWVETIDDKASLFE